MNSIGTKKITLEELACLVGKTTNQLISLSHRVDFPKPIKSLKTEMNCFLLNEVIEWLNKNELK